MIEATGRVVLDSGGSRGFVATDLTADVIKVDPDDLAEVTAKVIALPTTAEIAEILVNCRLKDTR